MEHRFRINVSLSKGVPTFSFRIISNKEIDVKSMDIRNIINNQKDVHKIDDLKTRLFGSKIYIDLEISVDSNISLKKAHQIAHNVHDEVEAKIKECKHCMIHVNPDIEKSSN